PPSVIIRTKPGYRGGLRDSLKQHGNTLSGEFASINAIGARVACSDLETLAGFDSTLSVSVNARVASDQLDNLTPPPPPPPVDPPPAPPADPAPAPPADPPPAPPVEPPPAPPADAPPAPSDDYGHGTHVAGLAASQFVGVAPNARLIGLKVLNAQGQGTADAVLRAIEFAIVNKDLLNIQVLNLSLGHPIFEHAATDPMV